MKRPVQVTFAQHMTPTQLTMTMFPLSLCSRLAGARLVKKAAALLGAWCLLASSASAQSPAPGVQVQQFTLANGLTLIVKPDRRAPTVAHMLWVRVGSMDEVDGSSGVAHALEHMMFKGTPTLKPGEFSRRIAALGGRDNAFTSRDATAYHQQIPAARLDRALTQGADRVADSAGAYNGLFGRGPQVFFLDGVPAEGKTPGQVLAALRKQIERIAREGVSQGELQRVKTQWVASETYKLDAIFSQARELGSNWLNGFPLDANARVVAQLRTVTAQEVQSVAARYFGDEQLTLATLVPLPPDPNRKPRLPAAASRH